MFFVVQIELLLIFALALDAKISINNILTLLISRFTADLGN